MFATRFSATSKKVRFYLTWLCCPLFFVPQLSQSAPTAPLSAEEQQAVDLKLQQAMALYHDKAYYLALPIFQEVARKMDTLDLQYWMGKSAMSAGQTDTAIQSFETMLSRDPNLPKVRLELAMIYLKKGDKEKAQKQLDILLSMSPPEALKQQIQTLKQDISKADQQVFLSLRASLGYQYDSNINVQPDVESVQLANGGRLSNTKAKADHAFMTNLNLDVVYDPKKQGMIWRNRISYYNLDYNHENDFDYSQVDLRTSLEKYQEHYRWRLPIGYVDKTYAGKRLSHSVYIEPSFDYVITPALDWTVNLRYEKETFYEPIQRGQNNQTTSISLGPRAQFRPSWGIGFLTGQIHFMQNNTNIGYLGFREMGIGPSFFASIKPWAIDFFVNARYAKRQYNAPNLFLSPEKREDNRFQYTMLISKTLNKQFSVSASYSYSKTQSNLPLYDFDKSVFGINLNMNLDY